MAVSPINISRVSHNLQTNFVLNSLRGTQQDLFLTQSRIASGRDFVSPSEKPLQASRALDLTQAYSRQQQFLSNLQQGDNLLSAADSAFIDVNDLMIQASVIASQSLNGVTSSDEREAEAEIVARLRDQLQVVANRSINGRYIFGGRNTTSNPFVDALGAIAYVGDTQSLLVRAGDSQTVSSTVSGDLLFGALSQPLTRDVDLTPTLTTSTRIDDAVGAGGRTIETGSLVFNEATGAGVFTVDLSGSTTMGDIVDKINAESAAAGSGLTAGVVSGQLTITPGSDAVTITDTSAGATTRSLGITTVAPTTTAINAGVVARVTRLTPVTELANGAGIDLTGGLVISNGGHTATLDLSLAETVQDVINTINGSGLFVRARINEEGTGIDVFNEVSGTSLSIGENGGTTAADLGIRTMNTATKLSELNFGRGVQILQGQGDFRITARDGSTVDVDLDGALTIGDAIDAINTAVTTAGVSVTASFASVGNGILLDDTTSGTGNLSVGLLNLSTAALDLGLQQTVIGNGSQLIGGDVNPTRTEGIIGALVDLENALRHDDTQMISSVANRLEGLRQDVIRVQGTVGARSQGMKERLAQMEDAASTTQQMLSQVEDLDFASAATELQSAMTQLQANMQVSSAIMNLSLMDFI